MPEAPLPDRYQVLEELCRGEAEILLRAKDKLLQREVVICKPRAGLLGPPDKQDLERSLRQARTLARVNHPGVTRLLDVVETADGPVLAMEPITGETLAERIASGGPLDAAEVLSLAIKVCEALEAVHAVGIVHRGISTGTIALRADGTPCLTGFAFAKFGGDCQNVAATTFLYKPKAGEKAAAPVLPPHPAPEQISGQTADAR